MKISIDRDKCIGIGMCEAMAPHVFSILDDGTLELLTEDSETLGSPEVNEAVLACPTLAITLIEE